MRTVIRVCSLCVGVTLLAGACRSTNVTSTSTEPQGVEQSAETTPTATELRERLTQGRWRLVEASESFPDSDITDQGMQLLPLAEDTDRLLFYTVQCASQHAYLTWVENIATVGQNDTGVENFQDDEGCGGPPALADYSPPLSSTFQVDLRQDTIEVVHRDPSGSEIWSAVYEFDKDHLLDR